MRMLCGAVSGMVILAGLDKDKDGNPNAKSECYKLVQELCGQFKEENGSVICAELLSGCKVTPGFKAEDRNAEYYKARPCAQKVESAARIWARYYYSK